MRFFLMMMLSQYRAQYAAALEHDIGSIVRELQGIPAVEKVLIFGSYPAGRRDLFTDLDVLVIMYSDLDFVTRCAQIAGHIHASVALDVLVYTPQEIERMRDRPFIRQALTTGKVLYERKPAS